MRKLVILSLLLLAIPMLLAAASTSQVSVTVSVTPLEVLLKTRGTLAVGQTFTLASRVENRGETTLQNVTVTLFLPAGMTLVRGNLTEPVGDIPPGRHKDVQWKLTPSAPGGYVVAVRAEGTVAGTGEPVAVERALLVAVTTGRAQGLLDAFF